MSQTSSRKSLSQEDFEFTISPAFSVPVFNADGTLELCQVQLDLHSAKYVDFSSRSSRQGAAKDAVLTHCLQEMSGVKGTEGDILWVIANTIS